MFMVMEDRRGDKELVARAHLYIIRAYVKTSRKVFRVPLGVFT